MDGRVRERILSAPDSPGVYVFKKNKRVLYVGKAKSLNRRLRSYLHVDEGRLNRMLNEANVLEIIPTADEESALILEAQLIRKFKPPFNVRLKNHHPFLYLHLSEDPFPKVSIVRNPEPKGKTYGPFLSRKGLREFLKVARKVFPIRNCSLRLSAQRKISPCVEYHIGRCLAPCAYEVSKEYSQMVEGFERLLEGDLPWVRDLLYRNMMEEANKYNYEAAAMWRDRLKVVQKVLGRKREGRRDVWAMAIHGELAVVVLYSMRGDNPLDVVSFLVKLSAGGEAATLREMLTLFYANNVEIPDEIVTHVSLNVGSVRSAKVKVIPSDDPTVRLALEYAHDKLISHLKSRERMDPALLSLKEKLHLLQLPRRIEGYDISHIFGEYRVASAVVFVDGKPAKSLYRRYKIKNERWADDYAAMYEVVKRRFTRLKEENETLPDLVLIDGGPGQLFHALKAMEEVGVSVPTIALAKRFERIHLPNGGVIQLKVTDPALKILMRIRDEAHRFALKYHRTLRRKKLRESILDFIPGIGKRRKMLLLSHFGSVERIKEASLNEITSLPGFGPELAKRIKTYLTGERW
ncbi:MAG: excinuclease ABC subunit UvrC [Thermotogae bacterium]|nr:excinuclease ABC subunit UvrC [Thermotogota bacterium]